MMQTVLPSEFKRGMVLMLAGVPQAVEEFHISGTAQTKPKLHARLRHLRTGRLTDHTFSEGERVPLADVQYRRVEFSYHDPEDFVFSDVETFEELTLSTKEIGERRWFIKENQECRALFLEGRPVDIILPPTVVVEVTDTAAPIRGGSDGAWQPAILDAGLGIMGPRFIAPREQIRVYTIQRQHAG